MTKKGEYYNLGKELLDKMEDISDIIELDKYYPDTRMAILLEAIKKIEELETRIIELEKGI